MRPYIIVVIMVLGLLASGCVTLPCPDDSQPVCGPDGKTYRNPCLAKQAGLQSWNDGACTPAPACTDSDGGKDIFSAGTVADRSGSYSDRCTDAAGMEEWYCEGSTATSKTIPCPTGYECQSGACIVSPCTDTDGGKAPDMKGTASVGTSEETDECENAATVKEFYCSGGKVLSENMACGASKYCSNGACGEKVCTDSDNGKNTSKTGTTASGPDSQTDSCFDSTTVKEYFCDGNTISNEKIACASGYSCDAGKCVKSVCTDSDSGKDQLKKGTTAYGNLSYTDSCYSDTSVLEYYCASDTTVGNEKISCGTGKECYDGLCRTAQCQKTEDQIDETDTRQQIAAFDDADVLKMYVGDVVEINDEMFLKLYQVSGNKSTFRLYADYEALMDGDQLCSTAIEEGNDDNDLCDENTGTIEVDTVDDSSDFAEIVLEEYYATQYYSEEGLITDWTDSAVCPDDTTEFDSHVSYFYPYLDTVSSGLNLDSKKFKLFGLDAKITEVTDDTFTFELDGDEYEVQDGDTIEYLNQDYDVNLQFTDGGLYKFDLQAG